MPLSKPTGAIRPHSIQLTESAVRRLAAASGSKIPADIAIPNYRPSAAARAGRSRTAHANPNLVTESNHRTYLAKHDANHQVGAIEKPFKKRFFGSRRSITDDVSCLSGGC